MRLKSKKRLVLAVVLLAMTCVSWSQGSEDRTFEVGDVERFNVNQTISRPGFKISTRGVLTQKVVKVLENGDAEIESATSNVFYTLFGKPDSTNMPADKLNREMASTEPVEKTIYRLTPDRSMAEGLPDNDFIATATQYTLLAFRGRTAFKVGEKISVTLKDGENAYPATTTITAIRGSAISSETIVDAQGSTQNVKLTSTINRETLQILSLKGVISGLNSQKKRDGFDRIEFSLARLK